MKVKIGDIPNRLVCSIYSNRMNKKYGSVDCSEALTYKERALESIEDVMQRVYDVFNWIWFDRRTQQIKVRIDKWDTWSMDHTLASIILPMLKQLRETTHGAPNVDDVDVPKELKSTSAKPKENDWDTDSNHFKRWDWVLDEMIWAFEQKNRDSWEEDYYGPYIEGDDGKLMSGHFAWVDDEGRLKHQERMTNGFRLFGKYYENLWD
jgi:hypothetical protein